MSAPPIQLAYPAPSPPHQVHVALPAKALQHLAVPTASEAEAPPLPHQCSRCAWVLRAAAGVDLSQ